MLKDYIKKCALLLNRDDILDAISSSNKVSDISSKQIQNDVLRLISYFNFTVKTICEEYFDLTLTESFVSDDESNLYYYRFNFVPLKVLEVKDQNKNTIKFNSFPEYLNVGQSNTTYFVTYKYIPNDKCELTDCVEISKYLPEKIIIYGIVSEFLASKNQYTESEFWKNKFLYNIFKLKTKKERRIKSTFCK